MEAQLCTPCPASTVAIGGNCLTDGTGVYLEQGYLLAVNTPSSNSYCCVYSNTTSASHKIFAIPTCAQIGAGM
jgi:hypothetical protein